MIFIFASAFLRLHFLRSCFSSSAASYAAISYSSCTPALPRPDIKGGGGAKSKDAKSRRRVPQECSAEK
jgi:hypothetical protein